MQANFLCIGYLQKKIVAAYKKKKITSTYQNFIWIYIESPILRLRLGPSKIGPALDATTTELSKYTLDRICKHY